MSTRFLRIGFLALAGLSVILLTGCSGGNQAVLAGSSWPGVAVTDDTIYLAFGPGVYAINPETGLKKWSFPDRAARGQTFYAPPAVTDDIVVVGDYTGNLFALNPDTGSEVWTFQPQPRSRFVGGAAIGEQYVYAGTVAGVMYALDRDTGAEAWKFAADRDIWSAPLLAGETLYFTTLDRHLYAVDAKTGDMIWQFPEGGTPDEGSLVGPMVGTPMLYGGVLYFGSFNNRVYALDADTRELLWTYDTANWVWSSPVLDEETGLLIGGDLDGKVFALDHETGEEVWTFETDGPVVSTPALSDREGQRVAYVTSGDSRVYTLAVADGSPADTPLSVTVEFTQRFLFIPTGSTIRPVPVYAPAVLTDDLILMGTHQGTRPLFAYERDTMRSLWVFDPAAGS